MSDKVLAWLWLPAHTKVEVGQTLTTEGPLKYASPRALDALEHASGPVICRISSSGKVLAMADATMVLHEFMCGCAEQALLGEREAGREPDKRSWAAIETKRKWLKGEATDAELCAASVAADAAANATGRTAGRAACAAASDAASAVAIDAAWYASWSAARSAAWSAACAAARNDTWESAWSAAWESVWVVARDVQNAKLEEMLNVLLKEGEGK